MKKQTAVQWLIEQVEDHIGLIPVDIIQQAKAMAREQIVDAFQCGEDLGDGSWGEFKDCRDYYTQTYEQ